MNTSRTMTSGRLLEGRHCEYRNLLRRALDRSTCFGADVRLVVRMPRPDYYPTAIDGTYEIGLLHGRVPRSSCWEVS